MPKGRRKAPADRDNSARRVSAEDKIARLLGMLLIKDLKKKTDQVPLLRSAGFEVSEVADMLGITEKHVTVAHVRGRKKRKAG